LKTIALVFDGRTVRGEAMITASGLEGGAVYALGPRLRDAIDLDGSTTLHIDIRPDLTLEALQDRLARPRGGGSLSNHLRKAGLTPLAINLLREASGSALTPEPAALARLIKGAPIRLIGSAPLARAISTAGGVRFDAISPSLMLKARPGVFVAGEMLDWEAPTGGYLLQAAFATGRAAARGALDWLAREGAFGSS
jgi:predicted flavoprotein YhiN